MATNGITPPTNERPNYFAGQYLLEDDFQLEQQYHIDRQRWHHHLLHVSGIAEGLKVTKGEGDLAVNVSEGSAIDPQGQQIILLDPETLDLPKIINSNNTQISDGTYILYIGYSNQKTDQQIPGNDITSRRWQEAPKFQLSTSELKDFIALAKLTISSNAVQGDIDNSVRVYSGLRLPSFDGEISLRFTPKDGTNNLAELQGSLSVTGNVFVTGYLVVKGSSNTKSEMGLNVTDSTAKSLLSVRNDGNVGIGTTTPTARLDIDRGTTNDLALAIRSSGSNWGSGMQLVNTASKGNTYGIYSGSDGKLHLADATAQVDRLTLDREGNFFIDDRTPFFLYFHQIRGNADEKVTKFHRNQWFGIIAGFSNYQPPEDQAAGMTLEISSNNDGFLTILAKGRRPTQNAWSVNVLYINKKLIGSDFDLIEIIP